MSTQDSSGLTYRDAGVDIDEADRLIDRIKDVAKKTHGPEVLSGLGGFAALFSLKDLISAGQGMEDPVLVAGTDGVGTKLKVAFGTNDHGTVGIDLVAMCVNDVVTTGATPLFFLDYFGTGKLSAHVAAEVVTGIAEGCRKSGCALVGGETAELPGLYGDGEYDLAGFCVGILDRANLVDGSRVAPGDVVIGIETDGLHSNGYSLAQKVLIEHAGLNFESQLEGCEKNLGRELLRPTDLYAKVATELAGAGLAKAMAHITGGGLPGNLPRVMPADCQVVLDKAAWQRPALYGHIQGLGNVAEAEMYRTFNMGIGLCVICGPDDAQQTLQIVEAAGFRGRSIGEVTPGVGAATLAWADTGGAA